MLLRKKGRKQSIITLSKGLLIIVYTGVSFVLDLILILFSIIELTAYTVRFFFLNSLAAEVVRTIEMIPAAVKLAPLGFQYLNSLLCFLDADNSLSK